MHYANGLYTTLGGFEEHLGKCEEFSCCLQKHT